MNCLQHRFPYPYSQIYSTRGLKKNSMLESMLEILQQFYIQMESEPHEFSVYPGDLSTYMLWCIRCGQPVTYAGSIGETLFHAPTALLYHWNMIQSHDNQNDRESMLMPLLFTSYDNYLQSLKSFQEGLNWMENLNFFQKPTKYGQVMFCLGCIFLFSGIYFLDQKNRSCQYS